MRAFLQFEWEARCNYGEPVGGGDPAPSSFQLDDSLLPLVQPASPKQENGFDCGVFVLRNLQLLLSLSRPGGVLQTG